MAWRELNELLAKRIQEAEWDPHATDMSLSFGFVSLMVWSDFLRMDKKERDFIFDLADQMRAFREAHPLQGEPPAPEPEQPMPLDPPPVPEPPAPGHYSQTEPCGICGEKKMPGTGMAAHMRAKHKDAFKPQAPLPEAPEKTESVYGNFGPPFSVPENSRFTPQLCAEPECGETMESLAGLVAHRRLKHGSSEDCIHGWQCGAPINGIVTGTCRYCSKVKDFTEAQAKVWR